LIFRPKADRKGSCTRERFCSNIFGRVMCPTDFSKPSVKILSLVRSMTDIDEISLVHVVDDKMHQEDRVQIEGGSIHAPAVFQRPGRGRP
jgi:hypothetical protein